MTDINEVLVPVDGSEGAKRALVTGAGLARTVGAKLTLYYVAPLTSESVMAMAKLDRADVEALQRAQGADVLTAAQATLDHKGLDVGHEVALGDPAEEILAYLRKRPGALVVMGRRGLSPLKSLMLGSVSDKVVRHASNPVMVVN